MRKSVPSAYDFRYKIRSGVAALIVGIWNILFVCGVLFLLQLPETAFPSITNEENAESAALVSVLAAGVLFTIGTVVCGYYFFVCRLVTLSFTRLAKSDLDLSFWATRECRMPVRVYRSAWGRTFSRRKLFRTGGSIYLGTEVLTLSQPAMSFLLHHEIGHLLARGTRWRLITEISLNYIDSVRDLGSGDSILLQRKLPSFKGRQTDMRELHKPRFPNRLRFWWRPVQWMGAMLGWVEYLLLPLLGPLVREEEFCADVYAASQLGPAAHKAMMDCAFCYSRAANLPAESVADICSGAMTAWSVGGLNAARTSITNELRAQFIPAHRPSWYPTWKERVLNTRASPNCSSSLAPETPLTSIVLGDRIVLGSEEASVLAQPYLHPLLAILATYMALTSLAILVGILVGSENTEGVLVAPALVVPTIGVLLLLLGAFLRGEEQFSLKKWRHTNYVPDFSKAVEWLSIEFPRTVRMRLAFAVFPHPLCLLGFAEQVEALRRSHESREWFRVYRRLSKLSPRDRLTILKCLSLTSDFTVVLRAARRRRSRLAVRLRYIGNSHRSTASAAS